METGLADQTRWRQISDLELALEITYPNWFKTQKFYELGNLMETF